MGKQIEGQRHCISQAVQAFLIQYYWGRAAIWSTPRPHNGEDEEVKEWNEKKNMLVDLIAYLKQWVEELEEDLKITKCTAKAGLKKVQSKVK